MLTNFYISLFHRAPIFLKPFFGPALHTCYGIPDHKPEPVLESKYEPAPLESYSNSILNLQLSLLSWSKYYLVWYLLRHRDIPAILTDPKILTTGGLLLTGTWFILGAARSQSKDYQQFLNVLLSGDRTKFSKYDFEMAYWPIDFNAQSLPQELQLISPAPPKNYSFKNPFYSIFGSTLGRAMIMPGSLGIINSQMAPQLRMYRNKLIARYNSKRIRIQVNANTHLDTLFIDQRARGATGRTLVVCSEGNAAFYEVGIMTIPARHGYSVFGWNRPGFAESSGKTNPENERASIKSILEYARVVLEFDNIIVFGWSIGGYPTSVASNIKTQDGQRVVSGVIMDATFDHISPLSAVALPGWFQGIAKGVIHQEWDLDVSRELRTYKGPVLFYRRLRDEILSTGGPTRPDLNRINWLVYDVIESRFPLIKKETMEKVRQRIEKPSSTVERSGDDYERMIFDFVEKTFIDLHQGHNEAMPAQQFRLP